VAQEPTVTCRHILEALTLYRHNRRTALERLERLEPDLAAHIMEALTHINGKITELGGQYRRQRQVYRLICELVMVSVNAALRSRHSEDPDPSDDAAES